MLRGSHTEGFYCPNLPFLPTTEGLFTSRFKETITSEKISVEQWVIRIRDLLTGQVLKTFQDLSMEDRISFATVKEKLLSSQNLTAERYCHRFQQAVSAEDCRKRWI